MQPSSEDVELAREVAALSWLADGVTEAESITLDAFASTGSTDLELMSRVTMLAWLNDGIKWNEAVAIKRLFSLAVEDADLGEEVMSTAWLNEEVNVTESTGAGAIGLSRIEQCGPGKTRSRVVLVFRQLDRG